MRFFSILEGASREAVENFAKRRNIPKYSSDKYTHPQEDYLLISENPPTFAVSDGVTLNFMKLIEDNLPYPNPSPAGDVSKIFCKSVIESAKKKYDTFNVGDITAVFKEANNEVAEYNKKIGKSDISGNPTGFYSATGSFVIIKDYVAYWTSICDSFVAHFDKNMNMKFISSGLCKPYAVINGEEHMVEYLQKGVLNLEEGDSIFIFTDGFEYYVKNSDFQKLFLDWSNKIKEKVKDFSNKMNLLDPEKYGHERSLIVISI